MYLKSLDIAGFKSFAKKSDLEFSTPITAIVGPNGSGKSNVAEAFRFVLGEQSIKSLRGKKGEDLIFSGTGTAGRLNRASVQLTFDNSSRLLSVDFDEVIIERAVFRDGTNEYSINGSKVRLKDVIELLAGANIGSTGHHIISQGEADRVLTASPKERRFMIEDALGLRVYHFKKSESEKKLQKTEENKAQVEGLRRENAPHLKFLEKQVDKIRKAAQLRDELTKVYREYLKREELYLSFAQEDITGEKEGPEKELSGVEKNIERAKHSLETLSENKKEREDILSLEEKLSSLRDQKTDVHRNLGKLEGQLAFEERRVQEEKKRQASEEGKLVPFADVKKFADDIDERLKKSEESDDLDFLRNTIKRIGSLLFDLLEKHKPRSNAEVNEEELVRLSREKAVQEKALEDIAAREHELSLEYKRVQKSLEEKSDESREAERELFDLITRRGALEQQLTLVRQKEHQLSRDKEEFRRELAEAGALVGRDILSYKEYELSENGAVISLETLQGEDREKQYQRRRDLERMKIRLEEMGGANVDEVMKEYDEVRGRDEFLAKEIADLDKSAESLLSLIRELDEELAARFEKGIEKIAQEFHNFFVLMFGGGAAKLLRVAEQKRRGKLGELLFGKADEGDGEFTEEEDEADNPEDEAVAGVMGIDISVQLPNKRVQSLLQLSGGERALTSIALIFAMSQVNPPPFLILDETDAALDEANSRRYGDMIENLAKKSQLILITHNRETMSRAGILYGVTMGADGVSKLLSVKFEEGVSYAK